MKVMSSFTKDLISAIQNGAVGVLPTDTVYGLACQANNPEAVHRLYVIKDRNNKPGTVIAANIDQLVKLGLTYRYLKAVSQFWPGPTSVIIPCPNKLNYIHRGLNGIAVRLPAKNELVGLLLKTGPLLTTSANYSGQPTASSIKEAQAIFKDKVDFYVDGGDLSSRLPSRIVRLVDDFVEVVLSGEATTK